MPPRRIRFHRFLHGSLLKRFIARALSQGKRETAMQRYRAYLINEDNCVASYRPIEAATDEQALEAAKQLVDGHDVEVWLLDREIGRLKRN